MAYADLLDSEGIKSQYLVVIKPRRLANTASWALVSGTKYSQTFSFGQVVTCKHNDTLLDQASSSSLSDGDWYWNEISQILYIDIGSDPALADIVATYELYIGTFDGHFNRDPLDSSSRVVYYEPLISRSPQIQSTSTDTLFGFLPSLSTSIEIVNLTQYLQEHLYSSSFNRCDVAVYHWLDELETGNVKLVTRGVCGSVSSNDQTVQITVYDNNSLFNAEFRHPTGDSFYAESDFAFLDPNFQARPIRKVYGLVDAFIPVNIDYQSVNPANTDNRTWSCLKPHTNLGSVSTTVPASPACTTTRTYVASINGIMIGDSVWIDSSLGSGFDEFVIVTAIGANYFEHAIVANIAQPTDVIKRSFVGNVTVFKDGVAYTAQYGKHYDEYTDGVHSIAGFSFFSTMEADLGISVLTPQDLVYARLYGNKDTVTLGGNPFGTNSAVAGCLTQGVVVFFDIMKNYLEIEEAKIDLTAFTTLQSTLADELGFAIPSQGQLNFPTFKDLFSQLAISLLLKIFINDDNEFSITQTGPVGATNKTIADDEILRNSFSYNFDYNDIRSDIFVQYKAREVSQRNQPGQLYYSLVNADNPVAKRLHQIKKQETYTSLHFIESEAQTLANRLSYALGERRGIISFTTKNRFFDSEINQVVSISRTKIPGYAYDVDTLRTSAAIIVSTDKSLAEIKITLDDQKGIEDNSDNW